MGRGRQGGISSGRQRASPLDPLMSLLEVRLDLAQLGLSRLQLGPEIEHGRGVLGFERLAQRGHPLRLLLLLLLRLLLQRLRLRLSLLLLRLLLLLLLLLRLLLL